MSPLCERPASYTVCIIFSALAESSTHLVVWVGFQVWNLSGPQGTEGLCGRCWPDEPPGQCCWVREKGWKFQDLPAHLERPVDLFDV